MPSSSRAWRRRRIERGIYQQPNGSYAVCVMIDGKPRLRTVAAATLAEAHRERERLRAAARVGQLSACPHLTFGEMAARWLQEFEAKVAAGKRRERTLDPYRGQLERHLLPRLGRRRLRLISADELAELVAELQANGLAPWTVKGVLVPLSCVFNLAVRRGYLDRNPLRRLDPDELPHPQPSHQRVLTHSELARLLRACPARYRPLLATAVYTGMRFSKLLALSWDDVDFAAAVIHVRHQLARGRRGIPAHRVPPKTRASVREIPLVPQLAAVLRQHKHDSGFNSGSDYVFTTRRGTPFLHRNVAKRVFTRALVDAELAGVRFHDLRHTFASHLIIDVRLDVAQSQPHPRPRPHQHHARHLHAPLRASSPRRRRPRPARPQRLCQAAGVDARATAACSRPRSLHLRRRTSSPPAAPTLSTHRLATTHARLSGT